MKIFRYTTTLLIGLLALVLSGCNDEIDNPLVDEYPEQGGNVETSKSKVMWVVLDGVSGNAVRQAINDRKAYNMKKMTENAIYTFNGLADSRTSVTVDRSIGWHNLLTGTTNEDTDKTIFDRIISTGKTISFHSSASSDRLDEINIPANIRKKYADDAASVEIVISTLASADGTDDFIILNLSDLEEREPATGYYDSETGYVIDEVIEYVGRCDAHIGKIASELSRRSEKCNENWLFIITSSYGGVTDSDGVTVYDLKDRNTFCMVWNPRFSSRLQQRPVGSEGLDYNYFSPYFGGSKNELTKSAVLNDKSLFNFGYNYDERETTDFGGYTIQFSLYVVPETDPQTTNLSLITKAKKRNPGANEGWDIGLQDRHLRWRIAGRDLMSSGEIFRDGNWHTATFVFDFTNTQLKIFIDGKLDIQERNKHEILEYFDFSSIKFNINHPEYPLTIGKVSGSPDRKGGYILTNLQIYDTVLPNEFIAKNSKQVQLDQLADTYEYWNNLIGYWPMDREDDFQLNELKDYSKNGSVLGGVNAGKSDFTMSESLWKSGVVNSENIMPIPTEAYNRQVTNNVDVPYMTFQWLGIPVELSWKWTGVCPSWPYKNL